MLSKLAIVTTLFIKKSRIVCIALYIHRQLMYFSSRRARVCECVFACFFLVFDTVCVFNGSSPLSEVKSRTNNIHTLEYFPA